MTSAITCSYWVKKNNRSCLLKAYEQYVIDDKFYCKKHYKSIKDPETNSKAPSVDKKQCEAILKNKKQCRLFTPHTY